MRNENDTCRELVEPKLRESGWESSPHSMTEQYRITKGRIVVAGQVARRREALKADYLLKYTGDFNIAVVEAKAESELAANGVQQATRYGAKLRRKVRGAEIASESRYLARAGHLILSRIDARHGAVALLPDSLDGAVVTNDFPLFDFNIARVIPEYLSLVIKAVEFVELCKRASKGSTNRVRIKEDLFLALTIPLPSLDEQRRIVAKVHEAMGALDRAATFHAQTVADFDRLLIALAHRDDLTDDQKRERGWRKLRLGDVMHLDLHPVKVDPSQDYPNAGCFSFARGLFLKPPIVGMEWQSDTLFKLRAGQFTYLKLKAFEGAFAFVSEEFEGRYVSNEYPTYSPIAGECRGEWVFAHFKHERVWATLASGSKGIGARRERVNPARLLAHEAWVPPIPEHDRIAEVLAAQRRFVASDTFQKDSESLKRAILSMAFRGVL